MIGDTVVTSDLSAGTGDFPDATAHITTLVKVNQDAYSSEYRLRGDAHEYKLLIRNSVESPRKDGVQFTRHNAEFTFSLRADPSVSPPVSEVPYIFSITARMPKGGDAALMETLAGHLASIIAITDDGTILQKMLNFES